jgi:hypothetical protein
VHQGRERRKLKLHEYLYFLLWQPDLFDENTVQSTGIRGILIQCAERTNNGEPVFCYFRLEIPTYTFSTKLVLARVQSGEHVVGSVLHTNAAVEDNWDGRLEHLLLLTQEAILSTKYFLSG